MKFHLSSSSREIAWPLLLAGTITLCSGFPATVPTIDWLAVDKIGHFVAYGALATGVVRIKGLKQWPLLGAWWALVLASAYGLGDEFRQAWGGVRMFEWDDWVADTIGAITATGLYLLWPGYRRLMELPLPKKQVAPSPQGVTVDINENPLAASQRQ